MPRRVQFFNTGPPEVLEIVDAPLEEPGEGEVRLRVQAFGLNRSEVQYRRGEYPLRETSFPARLGKEACGVIDAIGPGVEAVSVGDQVTTIPSFDMHRFGVYADVAVVPAFALAPHPAGLSTIEAAAVWQQYLTAYGPLVAYSDLGAQHTVLVTAASSSVGRGAIDIAKLQGARAIATCRTREKADAILAGGADEVVLTADPQFAQRILELTDGRGVDVVFDPVAGPRVATLMDVTAPGGTLFLYGLLDPEPAPLPVVTAMRKGLTLRGYTLWEIVNDPFRLNAAKTYLINLIEQRGLRPVIDRVFDFDDIVQAHAYMESNAQNGKIVVALDGGR